MRGLRQHRLGLREPCRRRSDTISAASTKRSPDCHPRPGIATAPAQKITPIPATSNCRLVGSPTVEVRSFAGGQGVSAGVLGPCAMPSSAADDCWRLSGECGRWAAESHDNATRDAFRQMGKVWAQLAFSLNFTPPTRTEPVDQEIIEGSETPKNPVSGKPPILTE